jgi:hypothetical protein
MTQPAPALFRHGLRTVTAEHDSVSAIYGSRASAEAAISSLARSGFNMQILSLIGKDYTTGEVVVGFLNADDQIDVWASTGAFWGEMSRRLIGSALLVIPGFGPLFAAGPLVSRVIEALRGSTVDDGMSALGAGLYSIGIPKLSIPNYEKQLKDGKFIVIAHGSRAAVESSRSILTGAEHHRAASRACCISQSRGVRK